ncbi:hypothetical protein M3Y97_00467600 [Aphelenchoides bicaudatus]|nr:hypothetical protein M3Y97_00467600 [Aphelenchoides bicaudatus]
MSMKNVDQTANSNTGIDEIFSYMCSLAVQKCSKKTEKKKASAGGAAMRKRLLIKNFVTQMLDQEKQMCLSREQLSREVNLSGHRSNNKYTKIQQTRLEEDPMENDEELDVEETDEIIEDHYQPLNDGRSTRRSGSLSDSDEEDTDDENQHSLQDELTIEDSLNNNTAASRSNSLLPEIGTLDLDSHRPFAPNPYLMNDNALSLGDDGSTELDDELVSESFEFFPSKTSATAICPGSTKVAPSWHEPEADLFMLERSTPSLYYDDYSSGAGVRDSYGLTYCHEDFSLSSTVTSTVTSASELYPLSTVVDSTSSYLISTCADSGVVPSISHTLCGSNNFDQPAPLPTNFMEEPTINDQPSMTTLTSASPTLTTLTSTSGLFAELRTTNVLTKSTNEQHVHFDSMNQRDNMFNKCAEDNAKVEEAKEDLSVKELQESKLISTTLVDLVNMVPSQINGKLGDCRREALQDAFVGSRHITDLDTNEVQVTNLLPDLIDANGQSRSPRKRLSTMDYTGSLMSMTALSPKRIKL